MSTDWFFFDINEGHVDGVYISQKYVDKNPFHRHINWEIYY